MHPTAESESLARPDMFVLGFQEIVPLTAQQIVQTDPEKRRVKLLISVTRFSPYSRKLWEHRILDTLDRRPEKKANYIILRSEQVEFFSTSFLGTD